MWGVGQLSVNHVGQFCLDFIHLQFSEKPFLRCMCSFLVIFT